METLANRLMNQQTIRAAIDAIHAQLEGLRSELGESVTDEDVRRLAEAFSAMDDDHQAKFFVEVARIMTGWESIKGSHGMNGQAYYIGRHLATCECSTAEGRDLVEMIHYAMTHQETCPR